MAVKKVFIVLFIYAVTVWESCCAKRCFCYHQGSNKNADGVSPVPLHVFLSLDTRRPLASPVLAACLRWAMPVDTLSGRGKRPACSALWSPVLGARHGVARDKISMVICIVWWNIPVCGVKWLSCGRSRGQSALPAIGCQSHVCVMDYSWRFMAEKCWAVTSGPMGARLMTLQIKGITWPFI